MSPLILPAAALRVGWRHAVGDALRDARDAVAILMLPIAGKRYSTAPPLFRLRFSARRVYFEVRAHDAARCTRGRWHTLDRDSAPRGAAALGKLCKWYADAATEYIAKRDAFRFADSLTRDPNRCATLPASNNAPAPRPSGGSRGSKGPGGRASHVATFGHAPASGVACATHAPTPCPQCGNSNAR